VDNVLQKTALSVSKITVMVSVSLSISTSTFSILVVPFLYYSTTTLFYVSFISILKTILYPSIHLFHRKANWLLYPKSDSNFAPSIDRPPPLPQAVT
jgi:CBS domain containing-hemolysin-like protein